MRSLHEAESQWTHLSKYNSLSQLKAAVREPPDLALLTGLRSVCWKVFLLFKDSNQSQWTTQLRTARNAFSSTRSRLLRAIENQDEFDDPLSDDTNSPWNRLKEDEMLRNEIYQDVDRCMPENLYFREPATQRMLVDILFVWSRLNPDTSYRQGMHEILAPILWVVERDAIDPASLVTTSSTQHTPLMSQMFEAEFIAHDTFTMFETVMKHAKASYERSNSPPTSSGTRKPIREESAIVKRSQNIIDRLLRKTDPTLAEHFKVIDIVPQVFLMRWIRLLFGREFSFEQILRLWDRIFSEDPSGESVDYICLAMLLRIRWELLNGDNSGALALLLHYPEPSADFPPCTLIDDALYLKRNLHIDGGDHIVMKHTGRLPQREPQLLAPATPRRPFTPLSSSARFLEQSGTGGLESFLQEAAREVYARGEKWGVNRAVRDAVEEVRKNVQSHARSQSQSITSNISNDNAEDSAEILLQRITALEERNKALAKILEESVSDMWRQQKEINDAGTSDPGSADAFTESIAKVQLVQLHLEDSSLPFPALDTTQSWSSVPAPSSDSPDESIRDKSQATLEQKSDSSFSSTVAGNEQMKEGTKHNTHIPTAITPARQSSSSDLRHAKRLSRPPLNESSFSWILGQDQPRSGSPRSTFLKSTSPFSMPTQPHSGNSKSAARGSAAYLFGDDSVDDRPSNHARQGSKSLRTKEKVKPAEADDDTQEVINLGSLNIK